MTEAIKFVDLVREYSATRGTGNIALKGAPPGFRSFAASLESGERFYYTLVNLSHPEQTETGIGTMATDGTIARTPDRGEPIDLGDGTKIISLVVGASWLEAVNASIDGEGVGALGVRLDGIETNVTQIVRNAAISVLDHGAVPDEDTSEAAIANRSAFEAAASAAAAAGKDMLVPAGTYWVEANGGLATGIHLDPGAGRSLRIIGEGGASIRRRGSPALAASSALVWMVERKDVAFEWHGVTFDGNEANCALDPDAMTFIGAGSVPAPFTYAGPREPYLFIVDADGRYRPANATSFSVSGSAGAWSLTMSVVAANGTQYAIVNTYADEQSANIRWLPTETGRPRGVAFFNCDVGRNRVGDGYLQNVTVDHFMASHCRTTDPFVRRVRADWQFSRPAAQGSLLSNIECNSLEAEPSYTPETARFLLCNVLVHSVLDLAGDVSGAVRRPLKVTATNLEARGDTARAGFAFVNLWRVEGNFHNCRLVAPRRFQGCKLVMEGGELVVANDGNGAAVPIEVWHDIQREAQSFLDDGNIGTRGNHVTLRQVRLSVADGVTTGWFLHNTQAANLAEQFGDEMVRISLVECHVPQPIDYVVSVGNAGTVELRDGHLQANIAIVRASTNGGYMHLAIRANTLWDAPALLTFQSTPEPSSAFFNLSGAINFNRQKGGTMQALSYGQVNAQAALHWNVDLLVHVDGDPNGNVRTVPGLRARVSNPAPGKPVSYVAGHENLMTGSGYGGLSWKVLEQPALTGSRAVSAYNFAAGERRVMTDELVLDGAAVGDLVEGVQHDANSMGLAMNAWVHAPGRVTVAMTNDSGGPVELPGGSVTVVGRKIP